MQSMLTSDRIPPYAWAYQHLLFEAWQRFVRGRPIASQLATLESS